MAAIYVPDPLDGNVTLLKKILWTLNASTYGVTDAGELNTYVASNPSGGGSLATRVGGFTGGSVYSPASGGGAYNGGDAIGVDTPLLSVLRSGVCTGVLQSIVVVDRDNQKAPIDFLFYGAAPTTSAVNNSAFAINAADVSKFLGKVSLAASDYTTIGTVAVASLVGVGLALQSNLLTGLAAGTVWVVPVTSGTPTYATPNALTFRFTFLQD